MRIEIQREHLFLITAYLKFLFINTVIQNYSATVHVDFHCMEGRGGGGRGEGERKRGVIIECNTDVYNIILR